MRNTSDPITKENSNVMNAQGGEKKVMKKILSVALSTAMAFSMFASVAFGDTAVSPQQQFDALKAKGIFNGYPDGTAGLDKDMTRAEFAKVITKLLGLKEITGTLSYTDKNYTAKNWAVPYIEAVTAAGIMEGKNVEKKIFDFNGKVTVSEMATILTRALDLEIPAETNNTAPAWAKGYVQAAINAGLVDANTNFTANASRELLVGAAYAIDEAQSLKVSSYTVTEGGKVVEFKISDGETVKVTLDKALEANKETEVKFTYKEKSFTEKVTYVVEAATKVQSASSVNLKEVDVAFDGKVDKATATDKANYSVDGGAKIVKSVTLLEDGKTARVLLNESSRFVQGTSYKVVVKNVKSSTGTTVPQGEVSFTSADNVLPTVTEVKALGTKVIKVTFSEPIKAPVSSNFQLDDKAYVGNVTLGANDREVILRDYTGTISEGAHKLTASMIEDYAGLKSLASTTDFTVAVDNEGPKVTEITATLEKVTVTFDEEIDPQTVNSESFYWLSGTTKKVGKATQISGNVYEVDFTENRLPGYETTLYVDVKDYSGNANATKEHKVTASVDLVQPKLIDVSYGTEVANRLTVRFDKAVTADDIKYFTVTKGSDNIPVRSVSVASGSDNKVFNVEFYSNLESGTYNLKVSGVQDKTALKNTMTPYEGTFVASDSAAPALTAANIDVNETGVNKRVALTFNKAIDLSTLGAKANYYIGFKKNGTGELQEIALPAEVSLNVSNGGKTVILVFPETIQGTDVSFPSTIEYVSVVGLKSTTGQATGYINTKTVLSGTGLDATPFNTATGTQKDSRTVEVSFNLPVASATASDFAIAGTSVSSVSVSDNKVTLKTTSDINANSAVTINSNNALQTYAGNKYIGSLSVATTGQVSPKIDESALNDDDKIILVGNKFEIPFTTNLDTSVQNELGAQLRIVRADATSDRLSAINDYTTTVSGNKIVVTVSKPNPSGYAYLVNVTEDATLIRNSADHSKFAAKSSVYRTTESTTAVATGVTFGTASITTPGVASTTGTAEVNALTIVNPASTAAGNITVSLTEGANPAATQLVSVGLNNTPAQVASAIVTQASFTGYTLTIDPANPARVLFTAATPAADKAVTISVADTGTTGVGTPSGTEVTTGVAPTTGTPQVVTLPVTHAATANGSVIVTFNNGTTPTTVTVPVTNGEAANVVALKIANAFNLADYTVSANNANVVFTANAPAANNAAVTVTAN
ncbi:S-layer homology domain-containing protein [Paenibacillus sp. ClWae2A]|uniref:S-layer homology domain-containing protein n=1 Tax=Paenibacillus sp. ClWae2A TaxID=3057177 RepID=UPI0028F571F8|nr:S-layer homology domain-containing protein [Paenibacillus sp. ClWae2A]MDT9720428.1 S-layer homology domain-containing protein [Paenibacillus sp. ClWae2A]